jgi:hypothetical protein
MNVYTRTHTDFVEQDHLARRGDDALDVRVTQSVGLLAILDALEQVRVVADLRDTHTQRQCDHAQHSARTHFAQLHHHVELRRIASAHAHSDAELTRLGTLLPLQPLLRKPRLRSNTARYSCFCSDESSTVTIVSTLGGIDFSTSPLRRRSRCGCISPCSCATWCGNHGHTGHTHDATHLLGTRERAVLGEKLRQRVELDGLDEVQQRPQLAHVVLCTHTHTHTRTYTQSITHISRANPRLTCSGVPVNNTRCCIENVARFCDNLLDTFLMRWAYTHVTNQHTPARVSHLIDNNE